MKFCEICGSTLGEKKVQNGYDKDTGKPKYYTEYHCPNKDRNDHINHSAVMLGGGCFIATAVYGTPLAPEIELLRNWRDTALSNNFFGRLFIRFYYKVSPLIADFIQNKELLKRFIFRPIIEWLIKMIDPNKNYQEAR